MPVSNARVHDVFSDGFTVVRGFRFGPHYAPTPDGDRRVNIGRRGKINDAGGFQVNRPLTMKKDGIQTRKRKPKNPSSMGFGQNVSAKDKSPGN